MLKKCEVCGKKFIAEDELARACFECFEKSGLIEIVDEYFEEKNKEVKKECETDGWNR